MCSPGTIFRVCVAKPVFHRLLLRVLLVVPRKTYFNLLKIRINFFMKNFSDDTAIPIMFGEFNRDCFPKYKV